MRAPELVLLPAPRRLERRGPGLRLSAPVRAAGDPGAAALGRLAAALARRGLALERTDDPARAAVVFADAPARGGPEAYRLDVGPERASVLASAPAGRAHGASTLAQLVDLAGPEHNVPGVLIDDAPALARRGAMLDVSRDRVPTMATLFELVELFASLKLNELQLYTEHAFAYAGHEQVWRDASPITPAELRALDGFAAQRGVELVPNQNCFGHMHRWLKHARYRPLAEVPEGLKHAFALEPEPFSLCPGDPRALALIEDLLDQLLPCCASRAVNAGLDETFDLGLGRSREACAQRGVGRVYLEHLLAVHRLAAARGRSLQFWADILMRHAELAPEVPRDALALLWGYDADHPFAAEACTVAASGLSFYVCPGTSSWQSFGGRTANMLANAASAARSGLEHGAEGLLVTDWGDRGHLQPLPVSFAGFAHAAELAWNGARTGEALEHPAAAAARLAAALDLHVFRDPARRAGEAALELGRVEEALASGARNGTAPFFWVALVDEAFPSTRVERTSAEALECGRAVLARARRHLAAAAPARADGGLVKEELGHAADLIELGLELGAARLAAEPGAPCSALPAGVRAGLAARVEAAMAEHGRLWLARSRPGGREDSARWLGRLKLALAI